MRQVWRLKGNLGLANMGGKKLLLEFDSKGEALRSYRKVKESFPFSG